MFDKSYQFVKSVYYCSGVFNKAFHFAWKFDFYFCKTKKVLNYISINPNQEKGFNIWPNITVNCVVVLKLYCNDIFKPKICLATIVLKWNKVHSLTISLKYLDQSGWKYL